MNDEMGQKSYILMYLSFYTLMNKKYGVSNVPCITGAITKGD